MHEAERWDVLIVGGGFYGLFLAEMQARAGKRVLLVEREAECMRHASYANQARVHNGYHYPRSILTAVRSRVNFPRFVAEFADAVVHDFEKVYAIARRFSKVTANQFLGGMKRIGAEIRLASPIVQRLFDPAYIESAFTVCEYAFDADRLRALMLQRVAQAGVAIRTRTTVSTIASGLRVMCGEILVMVDTVIVCGYAQLNSVLANSQLPEVPLKHELTEMALVEPPAELEHRGITVMDGPFFSCMPFPARGLHTLSHVRYTPHGHWHDGTQPYRPAYDVLAEYPKRSAFAHMQRDAARYMPCISDCVQRDSLWEVKTVLPRSETDDSRPILFKPHYVLPGLHLVMGGKIDNVYDVADAIASLPTAGAA